MILEIGIPLYFFFVAFYFLLNFASLCVYFFLYLFFYFIFVSVLFFCLLRCTICGTYKHTSKSELVHEVSHFFPKVPNPAIVNVLSQENTKNQSNRSG